LVNSTPKALTDVRIIFVHGVIPSGLNPNSLKDALNTILGIPVYIELGKSYTVAVDRFVSGEFNVLWGSDKEKPQQANRKRPKSRGGQQKGQGGPRLLIQVQYTAAGPYLLVGQTEVQSSLLPDSSSWEIPASESVLFSLFWEERTFYRAEGEGPRQIFLTFGPIGNITTNNTSTISGPLLSFRRSAWNKLQLPCRPEWQRSLSHDGKEETPDGVSPRSLAL
jgi:hypothetical protein